MANINTVTTPIDSLQAASSFLKKHFENQPEYLKAVEALEEYTKDSSSKNIQPLPKIKRLGGECK